MSYKIEIGLPDKITGDESEQTVVSVTFTVSAGESSTRLYPGSPPDVEVLSVKDDHGRIFSFTDEQEAVFDEWFRDIGLGHAGECSIGARDAAIDDKYEAIKSGD